MSVLDLQGLEPEESVPANGGSGSRGSKGCNNGSRFSLLLC